MSMSEQALANTKTVKKTGAWLVRYGLEQVGVRYTFGIPGVHNTEIYDELNSSEFIEPILVTHECGGAFMADAISRTTNTIGTCLIVPAAGVTHAASGIAEASLDGIAMLVISGGIRTDTGRAYQLHDMDQHALLAPITKATFKVERHEDIVETLYKAYCIAIDGEPGPVFIEVPTNISMFKGSAPSPISFENYKAAQQSLSLRSSLKTLSPESLESIKAATALISQAKNPGLFLGWGTANATEECTALAEWLDAPVSTTLQGLSVFPGNHPLHTGMGFGKYAVPAAEIAFEKCDCLIAIGTRFSEIPTGSFSMNVPENLIHIDINPAVFDQNYASKIAIEGDAKLCISALLAALKEVQKTSRTGNNSSSIAAQKQNYMDEWGAHNRAGKINPALFFQSLRKILKDDAFVVADDGNHTFLTSELMPIHQSKHFICPSDFNCMGYCVPASIACKLAHPKQQVVGIVGDGAFMMTAMELITASSQQQGVVICVFNDGELSQISQAQKIPYNRKTCSVLGGVNVQGVACAVGADYFELSDNEAIEYTLEKAFAAADKNVPVLVNVIVDYSKPTRFTKGVVSANLKRFPLKEKTRFIARALMRKLMP